MYQSSNDKQQLELQLEEVENSDELYEEDHESAEKIDPGLEIPETKSSSKERCLRKCLLISALVTVVSIIACFAGLLIWNFMMKVDATDYSTPQKELSTTPGWTTTQNITTKVSETVSSFVGPSDYHSSRTDISIPAWTTKSNLITKVSEIELSFIGTSEYHTSRTSDITTVKEEVTTDSITKAVEINPCDSNPCLGGGTCLKVTDEDYVCHCFDCDCMNTRFQPLCSGRSSMCAKLGDGWYPDPEDCTSRTWCYGNKIIQNAECPLGYVADSEGSDQCKSKTESNCTTDTITLCKDVQCINGRCVDRVDGFQCSCDQDYTGALCETKLELCTEVTCINGGTCEDTSDSYVCHCPNGYTGKNCEEDFVPCASNPCQNGGTCIVDGPFTYHCLCAICECANRMAGEYCETETRTCLSRPDGYYPHPDDCSKYIWCAGLRDYTYLCGTGLSLGDYDPNFPTCRPGVSCAFHNNP